MWEFIKSICRDVGNLLGVTRPLFIGAIVLAAIAFILLIVCIIIIAKVAKARKQKKQVVNAKPIITQTQEQEKKEVVAEQNQVEENEESIAEQNQVEEKKEVIAEQKVIEEKKEKASIEKSKLQKKQSVKKTEENANKGVKKLNGKWCIEKEYDGEYVSKLLASNGEVMLTSEIYTTEEGALNGVSTIIRGVLADNFTIYQDKNKNYYYKVKTASNRLLCVGETYKTKDRCLKAVETVKRIAKDSPILDTVKQGSGYAEYVPAPLDLTSVKKGTVGKWRIIKTESGNYSAQLFASNGQLMLATEEVSLEKSAKNAIENVKKYSEQGNFIIDHDKFGRFYYKLRNAQKSVICMGESYETLESCISAIESVRRFALTAVLSGE